LYRHETCMRFYRSPANRIEAIVLFALPLRYRERRERPTGRRFSHDTRSLALGFHGSPASPILRLIDAGFSTGCAELQVDMAS